MAKRYKSNNKGKKKIKSKDIFFKREQKLNQLINQLMDYVFHDNVNDFKTYEKTNHLRLKIKENFNIQEKFLSRQSRQRRFVFYAQLSRFKSVYAVWKKFSYPVFIFKSFDLPKHLHSSISWYYVGLKKGYVVNYQIF